MEYMRLSHTSWAMDTSSLNADQGKVIFSFLLNIITSEENLCILTMNGSVRWFDKFIPDLNQIIDRKTVGNQFFCLQFSL